MGAYTFDDYKKDYVDGKIKDNHGDARHGGGNNKPDANLDELEANGAKVEAAPVVLENFDGMDYETIHSRMMGVSENIAPGYNDTLRDVAQQIVKGMSDLKYRLETLESEGGWKGKTHDAAMANLLKSYDIPEELRKGALALGVLSEFYSQTMSTNKHNILDQWQTYQNCLTWYSSETDTVKQYFNNFARDVMKNYYGPQITAIAEHQPAVGSAVIPEVGAPPPVDPPAPPPVDPPAPPPVDPPAPPPVDPPPTNQPPTNQPPTNQPPPFSPPDLAANAPGGGSPGGGDGNNGSPPPFSPPDLAANAPGSGSPGGGDGNNGSPPPFSPPDLAANAPGGGSPGGGSPGADSTPRQSFSPPALPEMKSPDLPLESGDGSGTGSGSGSPSGTGTPAGTPPTMPSLGANSPKLPDLGEPDSPEAGIPGAGTKFDPSKVLTDPQSIDAAHKLFNDPKTADAAKKLFGDPKFADAAKTLFGADAKGLLGDPKALDAAKTLFSDPEAADAVKTLFGDPETAKAAQQLLNDPHLGDIGEALKESGALQATGLPGLESTDGPGAGDLSRSVLGEAALSPSGISAAGGIPGVAAGTAGSPFEGVSSLLSGIMDGVNQIVETAQQGAAPQTPGLGGGPGLDGAPGGPTGGPGDHPGGGGPGGGTAGPGKMHLPTAGAPVAAANLNPLTYANALHPGIDSAQAGPAGGGAPAGGGQGGGGQGGQGKDHKGNRALRGSHHGEDLIGQPDAVVSVIGEDGADGGPVWNVDT
ncbi:hypothetical protein [Mycolicibacterium baixiangningiae]|uniref:hypothetical protein n=1 Tax=Mycolicibacterium baixiangningiae TaxID=2761578 RepID=UPI0018D15C86|nr:hypothetical protein [Mycolicibacterium baixiangningiae]